MKRFLIMILLAVLAVVALLVWLGSRRNDREGEFAATVSNASQGPSFEVTIEKPPMDRFLGGILPTAIETKLVGGELRFDHASRGAKIGSVGKDRVELSADGWELLIEATGDGAIAAGTRLVFPIEIAEKLWTLRCRPAERPAGYLRTNTRAGSDVIEGRFLVEIARCEDAKTGKILDTEAGGSPGDAWPSDPLTLRGSFVAPATQPWPAPSPKIDPTPTN